MGIKIVSQPIGSPILAAASTAMAQANQRTAEQQGLMWRQQVAHKYKTKELEDTRKFEQAENDYNFGRQNALRPMTPGLKGNLRAASDWAKLQDEARNIYSGLSIDPRSPEAQERLKQIAEDMAMLESVNPDPSPEEEFDKGRIFLDPSGSRIGPDGMPYKAKPEGGSELWLNPKTGAYEPPPLNPTEEAKRKAEEKTAEKETAAAQKEAERAAAAKEKAAQSWVDDQKTFANDERKRKLDAFKDKEGDHTKEIDAINSEYQQRLESLNNYMQNYGLRQPEAPAAPAAQIPTGEQLVGNPLNPGFGLPNAPFSMVPPPAGAAPASPPAAAPPAAALTPDELGGGTSIPKPTTPGPAAPAPTPPEQALPPGSPVPADSDFGKAIASQGGRMSATIGADGDSVDVTINGTKWTKQQRDYISQSEQFRQGGWGDKEAQEMYPGRKWEDLDWGQQWSALDARYRQDHPLDYPLSEVESGIEAILDQLDRDGIDDMNKVPPDVRRQLEILRIQREKIMEEEKKKEGK